MIIFNEALFFLIPLTALLFSIYAIIYLYKKQKFKKHITNTEIRIILILGIGTLLLFIFL